MTLAVDSSALIAVLLDEPERADLLAKLANDPDVRISAVTLHEARVVFARRNNTNTSEKVDELVRLVEAKIVPFDAAQADLAFEGFVRFGSGRYGLNLADCFSYALARSLDAPLLFKGEDFARTDVKRAV